MRTAAHTASISVAMPGWNDLKREFFAVMQLDVAKNGHSGLFDQVASR